MLDSNIKKYYELQEQLDAIKNEMASLKEEIVNDMDAQGINVFEAEDVKAQVVSKETVKYLDELAIIKQLKSEGLDRFIIEKVDTTKMNKELKTSMSLNESLNGLVAKTTAPTLIVKHI